MVIPIANHQVLAVHMRLKAHTTRTGERLGTLLHVSEFGFLVPHRAVCADVGKVVGLDSFQEIPIFGGVNFAPLFRELRDLFGFPDLLPATLHHLAKKFRLRIRCSV